MSLPAKLVFRDVAVRAVAASCRLVAAKSLHPSNQVINKTGTNDTGARKDDISLDLGRPFDREFVSAFSEIFNNISIHAYPGEATNEGVDLAIQIAEDCLEVSLTDTGRPFDPNTVPSPQLDTLPEGGMGLHIARALLDELDYTSGPPNVWRLKKFYRAS